MFLEKSLIILLVFFSYIVGKTQSFPPAAGFQGSTALYKDSTVFVNWAKHATLIRGYKDSAHPEYGFVSYGKIENVVGNVGVNSRIVSLGDKGVVKLTFNSPIVNGEGSDFAVFENGFFEEEASENAFLELAFVEVSTDGIDYIRFPAITEIQSTVQMGTFENINARFIHNFAGKYTKNYGTPFDLEEIKELATGTSIDLNEINFVKIIDVVGSVDPSIASFDSLGNKVNDPYPTAFDSGGFDLDAVGVIHDQNSLKCTSISIYPNPATQKINFKNGTQKPLTIQIFSIAGKLLLSKENQMSISILTLEKGLYLIQLTYENQTYSHLFLKD